MRVKASCKGGRRSTSSGGRQHPAVGVGCQCTPSRGESITYACVTADNANAVCWHPCQQSPLTSRLKANPKFKLLKKVSLAKAALLGYSPKKLHRFSVLGFAGQDIENKTEMKPAVRGLRCLKVRMKCLRGVIEAPLKFEQR